MGPSGAKEYSHGWSPPAADATRGWEIPSSFSPWRGEGIRGACVRGCSSGPSGRVLSLRPIPRVPSACGGFHPWLHSRALVGALSISPELSRRCPFRTIRQGGMASHN